MRMKQKMTKNEAEYEAFIFNLGLAQKLGVENLKVYLDSELVSGYINGNLEVKDSRLKELSKEVQELILKFRKVEVRIIRKELNT